MRSYHRCVVVVASSLLFVATDVAAAVSIVVAAVAVAAAVAAAAVVVAAVAASMCCSWAIPLLLLPVFLTPLLRFPTSLLGAAHCRRCCGRIAQTKTSTSPSRPRWDWGRGWRRGARGRTRRGG